MNHIEAANKRRGLMVLNSRCLDPKTALDYGLSILIADSAGNRRARAQAPISAFRQGEGMTLAEVAEELLV